MTEWTAPPGSDALWYPEPPPRARMHRAGLAAIIAACVKVRYSERDRYVRVRLAATYAFFGLLSFGLGIVIALALE